MDQFSEKTKLFLENPSGKSADSDHKYYVYALIDPEDNKIFYIGKGCGDRVFAHEKEAKHYSKLEEQIERQKIDRINQIKEAGQDVIRVIIHYGLTGEQALSAEAALISAFQQQGYNLTNLVAGYGGDEAITVEEFDRAHGAEILSQNDIKHRIMVIKINKLYNPNMSKEELYDAVRGCWRANLNRAQSVDYVFGVYHSLVVAVYKPTQWYSCMAAPEHVFPAHHKDDKKIERILFIDDNYQNMNSPYLYKSIESLYNFKAQNPISYLDPNDEDIYQEEDDEDIDKVLPETLGFKGLVVKIPKLYNKFRDMCQNDPDFEASNEGKRFLYEAVRGCWAANLEHAQKVDYVLGVAGREIVAIYKPTKWYSCKDAPEELFPAHHTGEKNVSRIFFVDDNYQEHDAVQKQLLDKSISLLEEKGLIKNFNTQNTVRYFGFDNCE